VKIALTAFALLLLVQSTTAQKTAGSSKDHPTFRQYPSLADFKGTPAEPQLKTDLEHKYRTQILTQAKRGPNFAGHFTVASWDCGSSCGKFVIIDARSGTIYDPDITLGCFDTKAGGPDLHFRLGSRLLTLTGSLEQLGCGTEFYEWDGERLKLLLFSRPLWR
jgi:hypothetical protein